MDGTSIPSWIILPTAQESTSGLFTGISESYHFAGGFLM
jgi:hypothetical protein